MKQPKRRRRLGSSFEPLEPRTMLHGGLHADLIIFIDGQQQDIPGDIGIDDGGAMLGPVSTESGDTAGRLHFDSDVDVMLEDFFDQWRSDAGVAGNNPDAVFNENQLLANIVDADNSVQVFVNGQRNSDFEDYTLQDGDRIILVYGSNPVVSVQTNVGPIVMELFADPVTNSDLFRSGETGPVDVSNTTANLLEIMNRADSQGNEFQGGDLLNMFFHRLDKGPDENDPTDDFVLQGGAFITETGDASDVDGITPLPKQQQITNEPGLSNLRGTIAMARRGGAVNSATTEFYFNLSDNLSLDTTDQGFTVFGQVLDMTTVDQIALLDTQQTVTNIWQTVLDGTSVVPSVATNASGSAALTADLTNETFDIDIFIEGITLDQLTGSGIFVGASGTNGDQIFDLGDSSQWTEEANGIRRIASGETFPAANIPDLLTDDIYIRIDTDTTAFPNGELRGRLQRRTLRDADGAPPITNNMEFVFVQAVEGGGTIRGRSYHDVDGNGEFNDGDVGISGTTVFLDENGDGELNDGEASTTTAADGSYFFHVASGTHIVRQVAPRNFEQSSPTSPDSLIAMVAIGGEINSADFGNRGEFENSLSGFVYIDADNDGLIDPGETRLGGVIVTLSGNDDEGVAVDEVQITNGDGAYRFTNVRPGVYAIVETQPEFLVDGKDSIGSQGGDDSINDRFGVTVLNGTQGVDNNFGERGPTQQFVDLTDFIVAAEDLSNFSSRFDDAVLAAVRPGGDQIWYRLGAGWSDFTSATVELSADETVFTIEAIGADSIRHTATLFNGDPRISILGRDGDVLIVRFLGTADELGLQPAPG